MTPTVDVVEFTDPACSWAWGTEPKLRSLRWQFGRQLRWRRVLGGLVPDQRLRNPDFDPEARAPRTSEYWSRVTEHTRMPYPVRLAWTPVSSEDACRAVKAAERQADTPAGLLLRRLREECFVFGRPADTSERVLGAAEGVAGLDVSRLRLDLEDPAVEKAYRADWEETRRPNDDVLHLDDEQPGGGRAKEQDGRMRYVFPTLLFRGPGGEHTVPGWKPWGRYVEALEAAGPGATRSPRPLPSVEEAFATWPLLAAHELEVLCGRDAVPPEGTISFDWGAGLVWMTEREAADRLGALSR